MEEAAPVDAVIRHLGALSLAIEELALILHRIAPDDLETSLRKFRLVVGEAQAGRFEIDDPQRMEAHRLARDILERAVARSREDPATSE